MRRRPRLVYWIAISLTLFGFIGAVFVTASGISWSARAIEDASVPDSVDAGLRWLRESLTDRAPYALHLSRSPADRVQDAWQRAAAIGEYGFSSEIVQRTKPGPTVANAGRGVTEDYLFLDGAVDMPNSSLHLTLRTGDGRLGASGEGLEVRIEDGYAHGRAPGGAWEPIDDFSDAFAPASDPLAYLAGASNVLDEGLERHLGADVERYSFEFDGPAFGEHMRRQLEEQLRRQGELPSGMHLDMSSQYEFVTGAGEVWLDADGLPLRLTTHLVYPRERGDDLVEGLVTTSFSGLSPDRGAAAWLPRDGDWWFGGWLGSVARSGSGALARDDVQRSATTLGTLALVAAMAVGLVRLRRSRRLYVAVGVSVILSLVGGPLWQGYEAMAFHQRLGERQAEERQRQDERDLDTELRAAFLESDWDPLQDPLAAVRGAAQGERESAPPAPVRSIAALDDAGADPTPVQTDSACSPGDAEVDTDEDGLSDCRETELGSRFDVADTDGDALLDGWEVIHLGTDPVSNDTDGDQLSDGLEVTGFSIRARTWYGDPLNADSNMDGILDTDECWTVMPDAIDLPSDLACDRDTDDDGTPDMFDDDNDGDGVSDKVDDSPYRSLAAGGGLYQAGLSTPFSREAPFSLVVEHLQADMPTFVDFQLRPVEPDHLSYALNVLDWPETDVDGQIQHVKDTKLPDSVGDMRLVPMLEIEMSGSTVPLGRTAPEIDVPLGDVAATLTLSQPAGTSDAFARVSGEDLSRVVRLQIRDASCGENGPMVLDASGADAVIGISMPGHLVTELADGFHSAVIQYADGAPASGESCVPIGNVVNAGRPDSMIDPEPLAPYGIAVREEDEDGTLVAYVPLNLVADETGGGKAAFTGRMLYAPSDEGWGSAHKVRVIWLVQVLTDSCDRGGLPDDATDELVRSHCQSAANRTPDAMQIVHTYDESWYLTGLTVREDHGLDVAIVAEDPARETPEERLYDDSLWALARGLQDSFLTGRDQDADGQRDITVETIAERFAAGSASTEIQRWGIPAGALSIVHKSYPHSGYVSHIMMTETLRALALFDGYEDQSPTLLFAQEQHQRTGGLPDVATVGVETLVHSLDMSESEHPFQTTATMSWSPYRYANTAPNGEPGWQSYPFGEYWDLMQVRFGDLFEDQSGGVVGDVAERAVQVHLAKSYYYILLQGQSSSIELGEMFPQEGLSATDEDLREQRGMKPGLGKTITQQTHDLYTLLTEKSFPSFTDTVAWYAAMNRVDKQSLPKLRAFGEVVLEKMKPKFEEAQTWVKKNPKMALAATVGTVALVTTFVVVGGVAGAEAKWYLTAALTVNSVITAVKEVVTVTKAVRAAKSFASAFAKAATSAAQSASKATKAIAVIGLIIDIGLVWGLAIAQMVAAGVDMFSMAFNDLLASAISGTITAVIMFVIAAIPLVGVVIVAIIAAIDAVIGALCGAFGWEDGAVGKYLCKGISGGLTEIIKWAIYNATVMADMEDPDRFKIGGFGSELVTPDRGTTVGSQLKYSATVTNTIKLVGIPIDWKAATYFWQYTDRRLKSSTFDYRWLDADLDFHKQLSRDTMASSWQPKQGAKHTYFVSVDMTTEPITFEEAGINRRVELYLSEGYAVPAQECWAVPIPPFLPPIPFSTLIPVCYIRDDAATNHNYLGDQLIWDVLPATVHEFRQLEPKGNGHALAWGQDGAVTFGVEEDADGDGVSRSSDPNDAKWDTDGDGLSDRFEIDEGHDATDADADADGLDDRTELRYGTDPRRKDTDSDGLPDFDELAGWDIVYAFGDGDVPLRTRVTSDPLAPDPDGDGLTDFQENAFGFNPRVYSDPTILSFESDVTELSATAWLLRFEDVEGTDTFADGSGFGRDGTCPDAGRCPEVVSDGQYGGGVSFDGGEWLEASGFGLEDSFTVALWLRPADAEGRQALVSAHDWLGLQVLSLEIADGGYEVGLPGGRSAFWPAAAESGSWQHVALTASASATSTLQLALFVDGAASGAPVDVSGGVVPGGQLTWTIGAQPYGGVTRHHFRGEMDDVAVIGGAQDESMVSVTKAGFFDVSDLVVRPRAVIDYRATVTNELNNRYAQGLLTTEIPTGIMQGELFPATFVLEPLASQSMSGTMRVADDPVAGVYNLTQVAGAVITDWREESGFAELWLPLDDPALVAGEAPPHTVVDRSGNMPLRNAWCTQCPELQQPGAFGWSAGFSGAETIRAPGFELGPDFTLSLWIDPDAATGQGAPQTVLAKLDDSGDADLELRLPDQANVELSLLGQQASWSRETSESWQHLAVVGRQGIADPGSTTVWLYVDGELVTTAQADDSLVVPVAAAIAPGKAWLIGGGEQGGAIADGYRGRIDDVRLFDRALEAGEIREIYGGRSLQLQFEEAPGAMSFTDSLSGEAVGTCVPPSCPARIDTFAGQGLNLGGAHWATIASPRALDVSDGNFTLSAWIRPAAGTSSGTQGLLGRYASPDKVTTTADGQGDKGAAPTLALVNGTDLVFGFGDGAKWWSTTFADAVVPGVWSHVALTYGPMYDANGVYQKEYGANLFVDDEAPILWKPTPGEATLPAAANQIDIGRASNQAWLVIEKVHVNDEGDGPGKAELCVTWDGQQILYQGGIVDGTELTALVERHNLVTNSGVLSMWEEDGGRGCGGTRDDGDDHLGTWVFTTNDESFLTRQYSFGGDSSGYLHLRLENPSTPFRGKLDEVTVVKRALDAADVAELAASATNDLHLRLDDAPGVTSFANAAGVQDATCARPACPTSGVPGRVNRGALFDGGDALEIAAMDESAADASYTMAMWTRPEAGAGVTRTLMARAGGPKLSIGADDRLSFGLGGDERVTSPAQVTGEWQHVAIAVRAVSASCADVELFVDGVSVQQATCVDHAAGSPLSESWTIGNDPDQTGRHFVGRMDEVRVLSEALEAAAVAELVAAAPVLRVRFDAPDGAIEDDTGLGHAVSCGDLGPECGTIKLRGLRCDACDESWPEDEACEPYALLDGERQTMRDAGGAAAWEAIDPSGSFCGEARLEIREESEWTTSDDSVGSWCSVGATGPSQGTCYSIGSLHRCSVDYEVDPLLTEQACPATGVVGQVGLAARFDGEDDMVRVEEGAPGSLGSTAFSIGAWVLPEQRRTGSQQLLRGLPHQASGSSAYGFGISAGSMTIDYYVQSGGQRRLGTSKGELLEDSWNHVMLTHEMRKDGECDLKLYLNGYLDAVTTDAECILPSPAASQLLVGGGSDDAPFVGRMDEVSLYARSLTALEVRDIFDYEGRYVEARDTRRLAVDNGPPHSVLRSYSEVLPYMANRDAVLLIEAVDDASGVSGVELSVDGVWSAAPACEDALGGTTWCPTFSPSGEGVYAMLVRATDFFGQREEPDLDLPYKVHVDARGPEVTAEYADSAVVTADPHPDIANAWQVRLDGAIRDPLIASGNDGSGVDDLSVIVSLENADGDVAGLGRQAAAVRHKPASPVVYPLRPQYCRDEDECTWEVGYVFTEADPSGPYTLTVEASDLVGNHSAMVLGQVVVDAAMPRARVDRANLTTVRPLTAALKLGGVASDRVVPVVVSRTVAAAAAPMTLTCGTTMLLRMDEAALATEADLAWAGEVHRGSICRIEPAAGTDVSAAAEVCGLPVAVDGSGGTLTFVADSGACDVLAPGAGVDGAELAFVPTLPGSPVINEPAEPGLVAHIAFDNARDEGAGLRLEDLSGGGHAATCSPGGCPVIVNGGPFGAAVVMDGVNDHLALADPEGLSRPASDVTLVALVRPSSRTLGDRAVIAAKADEYGLARSPDGALEWMVNGSWVDVDLSLPADRWTHVALAHEAGVTAVYVDGKRVASTSTGAISAAAEHAFTIGGAEGGVSPFDGRVDELLVFDRALAPKEVGRLARGSEPVLVLALDDARVADDVVLADSSGWEHDGTLHLGDASSVDSVVPGMVGRRAMRLAGEPWIEVGSFDAGDEFTLALWLRDDACRSGVLAQARDGAGERFKVECVVGHPDLLRIELAGQYQALSRPTAGGWHHVALVARRIDQNLAQVDLYQDGALASSSDGFGMASDWSADGVWSFGSGDVGYAAKEDGLFDDIRVYPRALSAQEVKALHASAWRPAAVSGASGAGVELVDWEASVPSGLEGSYRLDLRGVEHEARIDTSGRDERSWFGEVDTLEPRLSVSMERLGRTVRYTTVAEDFNIDEHTLRSPCGAGSSTITLRQPYESPWYLALAGQTAGTAKRPFGVTATCDVVAPPTLAEVAAAETLGLARDVAVRETGATTLAYVADGAAGLRLFDVTDPTEPVERSVMVAPAGHELTAVAVDGGIAYAASATGVVVVDVSDYTAPALANAIAGTNVRGVEVAGDILLVLEDHVAGGVKLYDLGADREDPPWLATFRPPSGTTDYTGIAVRGEIAFVTSRASGLHVIDLTDRLSPALLATVDTGGWATDVALSASGDTAYVADHYAGVQVIDVSSLASPIWLDTIETPGTAVGVDVWADEIVVADGRYGLTVLDAAAPDEQRLFDTPGDARSVAVAGDHAFVADNDRGLRIVDLTGAAPTGQASVCDTSGNCGHALPDETTADLAAQPWVAVLGVPTITGAMPDELAFEAEADPVGLASLIVQVDSQELLSDDLDAAGSPTHTVVTAISPILVDGPHVLRADVIDAAGQGASEVFTFTIDSLAPSLALATAVLTATHEAPPGVVEITGTVSDAGGVERVQVLVDGEQHPQPAEVIGGSWHRPWSLGREAPSVGETRSVTVSAMDRAGHVATLDSEITVDVVAPKPFDVTLTAAGVPLAPGDTAAPSDSLAAEWPTPDGADDVARYDVAVTERSSAGAAKSLTASVAKPFDVPTVVADLVGVDDARRLSVVVAAVDGSGNTTRASAGPVVIDGPLTPDYVPLDDPDGVYHAWMDSGCSLVGVDRRSVGRATVGDVLRTNQRLYATWSEHGLRLAWTGADWSQSGDLFVYLDAVPGGHDTARDPCADLPSGQCPAPSVPIGLGGLLADAFVWVRDAQTAELWRWSGAEWRRAEALSAAHFRFDGSLRDGVTDLYLPFDRLGRAGSTGPLRLVAFAVEEGSDRVWTVLPSVNGLSSPRLNDTIGYADDGAVLSLAHHYAWDDLEAGVCPRGMQVVPNGSASATGIPPMAALTSPPETSSGMSLRTSPSDGTGPADHESDTAAHAIVAQVGAGTHYLDTGLRSDVVASPTAAVLGEHTDGLWWMTGGLTADPDARRAGELRFLDSSHAPLVNGTAITYAVRLWNVGTDPAEDVQLRLVSHGSLALDTAATVVVGTIEPGEDVAYSVAGHVDTGSGEPTAVLIIEVLEEPWDEPVDRFRIEHAIDAAPPDPVGVTSPAAVIGPLSASAGGYAFDESGVPHIELHVTNAAGGTTEFACEDPAPADGLWQCPWSVADANGGVAPGDGQAFTLRARASDGSANWSDLSLPRVLTVDAQVPFVEADLAATGIVSGTLLRDSSFTVFGTVDDESGVRGVDVCVGDACESATLAMDPSPSSATHDDVPVGGVPIGSSEQCGSGAVARIFDVADDFDVGEVRVGIVVDHEDRRRLSVELESPDGTVVPLLAADGASGPALPNLDATLADGASLTTYDGGEHDPISPPLYEHVLRPAGRLLAFSAAASQGAWTLRLCDAAPSQDGSRHGRYLAGRLELRPLRDWSTAGSWSYRVSPQEPMDFVKQSIAMAAEDSVGNSTGRLGVFDVWIDNVPPRITSTQLLDECGLGEPVRVLEGVVSDGGGVADLVATVARPNDSVMRQHVDVGDDGTWRYELAPVEPGAFRISLTAADKAGNTATTEEHRVAVGCIDADVSAALTGGQPFAAESPAIVPGVELLLRATNAGPDVVPAGSEVRVAVGYGEISSAPTSSDLAPGESASLVATWAHAFAGDHSISAAFSPYPSAPGAKGLCAMPKSGASTLTVHDVPLEAGWNLVSTGVQPYVTDADVVVRALEGRYEVVESFEGGRQSYWPGARRADTLLRIDGDHGYWLKVKPQPLEDLPEPPPETAEPDADYVDEDASEMPFRVVGSRQDVATAMLLDEGWNLVGYRPAVSLTAQTALASLGGSVQAVLGYAGGALSRYPDLDDSFNTLRLMQPEHGYYVKADQAGGLVYPSQATGATGDPAWDQRVALVRAAEESAGVQPTNSWVNFFGRANRWNGAQAPIGTVVTAVTGHGVTCGATVVTKKGQYGLLACYGDDETTPERDGAETGETIWLTLDGVLTGASRWTEHGDRQEISVGPPRSRTIWLPIVQNGGSEPWPPVDACMHPLDNGGFEETGAWTLHGDPPPRYDSGVAHGGSRSLFLGIAPSDPNAYARASAWQAVDVPLGAREMTVEAWVRQGSESPSGPDRQLLLVYDVDPADNVVTQRSPIRYVLGERSGDERWVERQVKLDVTEYRGRTLWIYAGVTNDGAPGRTWMWLDDVGVAVCP